MKNLNKLYFLKIEIKEVEDEIKGLTEISSPSYSGMPPSGVISDPVQDFFKRKQKLLDKLGRKLEKYVKELERIENIIDGIEDAEVRVIARLRYIKCKKWEDIGKELHQDRSVCSKKLSNYFKNRKV